MKLMIILLSLAGTSWMSVAEEEATVVKKATVSVTQQTTVSKETAPAVQNKVAQKAIQRETPALTSSLKPAHHKRSWPHTTESTRNTTGFLSISVGHEAFPISWFEHYASPLSLSYGGHFSEQSSFEAGIKGDSVRALMIIFKYNYDFMRNQRWIPGLDISLSAWRSPLSEHRRNISWLDVGLEIGPYIKTFISHSHALFLRTGLTYDTSHLDGGISLLDLRLYLSVGIQWHF